MKCEKCKQDFAPVNINFDGLCKECQKNKETHINQNLSEDIKNVLCSFAKCTRENERLTAELTQLKAKLAEYEKAEEQGLLIKLPCKVGNYLYCVNKYKKSDAKYKVFKCYISSYTHCKEKTSDYLTVRFVEENIIEALIYPSMIGEYYFLTEAEALQALKER